MFGHFHDISISCCQLSVWELMLESLDGKEMKTLQNIVSSLIQKGSVEEIGN